MTEFFERIIYKMLWKKKKLYFAILIRYVTRKSAKQEIVIIKIVAYSYMLYYTLINQTKIKKILKKSTEEDECCT